MKKIKNILAATLLTVSALTLAACGKSANSTSSKETVKSGTKAVYRTLDEIKKSGKVSVGVFSDKNPFGYVDENVEYQG